MSPRRPANLSRRQWHALKEGLGLDPRHRPADVGEWVHRLNGGAPADRLPILATLMTAPQPRRRAAMAAVVGAALILIVSGAWWIPQDHDLRLRGAALAVRLWDVALNYAGSLRHAVERRASTPAPNTIDSRGPAESTAGAAKSQAATAPAPAIASATASNGRPGALPYADARRASAAPPMRARIELAANFVQVSPTEPFARVMVRRSGSRRSGVSFIVADRIRNGGGRQRLCLGQCARRAHRGWEKRGDAVHSHFLVFVATGIRRISTSSLATRVRVRCSAGDLSR